MPKGGKRQGAGRPKTAQEKVTFPVRGHKNVIPTVREISKYLTDIEISKEKN